MVASEVIETSSQPVTCTNRSRLSSGVTCRVNVALEGSPGTCSKSDPGAAASRTAMGAFSSTSALGTVATTSGTDAFVAGMGAGVSKALDRLAQYYIKLAENTFPVIEVDAGREIDVVITKGVRIDPPRKGEHTRELLTELGIPAPEVEALAAEGVIVTQ